MFNFFQDSEPTNDLIITLDTINRKLQSKRKQSLILACLSIFFLGNRYLIDSVINFFITDPALGNQLSLVVYLVMAMPALYFILSIVQEISNLMSQRDEISKLLM